MKIQFTDEELFSLLPNPTVVDNSFSLRNEVFDLYDDAKMLEYAKRVIEAYESRIKEST